MPRIFFLNEVLESLEDLFHPQMYPYQLMLSCAGMARGLVQNICGLEAHTSGQVSNFQHVHKSLPLQHINWYL